MQRKGKTKEELLREAEEVRRSRDELEIRVQERTKELQEQWKILDAFFSYNFTPFVLLDKDFNFIRVNEAYAKACQRDVSDFPGHNHFEFYPHEENEAIFRHVVETKNPHQAIAKPFIFPDHPEWGETYWDWTLTPLLKPSGEVEFLVFSLRDVTGRTRTHRRLAEQTELLDLAHDGILVRDMDGPITYWSRGAEEMYGWTQEEALGKVPYELLQTRFPAPLEEIEACIIEKGRWSGEVIHTKRNGEEIFVDSRWALQRDEHGRPTSILGINRDITEQKQIERRTYATNALLNLFSKISMRKEYLDAVVGLLQDWSRCRCVGIRFLDEQRYIPYESYVGFDEDFWKSENWLSVDHDQCACIRVVKGKPDPRDAPMMTPVGSFRCDNTLEFLGKLSEEEKTRFRGVCVQTGFKSVAIIPIRYRDEVFGAIHLADEREGMVPVKTVEFIESMAPLIGEAVNRFKLQEELRKSENRLKLLSSQLLTVQENERRRIAREIHDSIGQSLSAIKFTVENILQQAPKGSIKKKTEQLRSLIPLIQQSVGESRRIQMDLRPSILDDLGILSTISWFCREFQKTYSNIYIEKQIEIQENEVPDSTKTAIYRIIQEALNNISKHSKAYLVSLSLKKREGAIELTLQDNGRGFDLREAFSRDHSRRGMGLGSMRERAEFSGGLFEIESIRGKGTTIRATWKI